MLTWLSLSLAFWLGWLFCSLFMRYRLRNFMARQSRSMMERLAREERYSRMRRTGAWR